MRRVIRMPNLKTASKKSKSKKPTNAAISDAWIEKGANAHWREVWNRALEISALRQSSNTADRVVAHTVEVLSSRSVGDPSNIRQWGDWWLDEIDLGEWPKESMIELMQTIVRLAPPAEGKALLGALMEYTANELRFAVVANRMEVYELAEGRKAGGDVEQKLHAEVGVDYRDVSLMRVV